MVPPLPLASARIARRLLCLLLLSLLFAFTLGTRHQPLQRVAASTRSIWYRGNTHTHTNNSFDGDSSPAAVAAAYQALGYNFLFITDHNILTDVDSVNTQVGVPGQFLVIKGEEVTDTFNGKGVHIIALNNNVQIPAQHGTDVLSTIENNVSAVAQAGGVSIVAHPNFTYALTSDDLQNVTGTTFFEVYNAHPYVNNNGDATHSSVEAKWDAALTGGKLLYGLAVDDEHTLTNPSGALPGRGWVMVRAASLDADAILQAMANGDFYASTGVTLQDYQLSTSGITITLDPAEITTIDFIGRNGQLLQRSTSSPAHYAFTGHEQYVRAKVVDNYGHAAWTQPIYTERLNPADAILNSAAVGQNPGTTRLIAPDSIALASGIGLAASAIQSQRQSDGTFPTVLAGTTVRVNGQAAEIYYASSTQVTFHVPPETEPGIADVLLTKSDGVQLRSQIMVAEVAPGIFTENGSGRGNAVVFDLDNLFGKVFMGDDGSQRFYLYATGVRGAANVQALINGIPVTVEAVRSCRGLPGLDQITIVFQQNMFRPGAATLQIEADGLLSNSTILNL